MTFPTETAVRIREAINDTIRQLQPAVMSPGLPEPTRTALQAHLEHLLQQEKALFTTEVRLDLKMDASGLRTELARLQAQLAALKAEKLTTPWYPDDSGDWVEGHPRDLPPDTPVHTWLYARERNGKYYNPSPEPLRARDLAMLTDIIAYKVVKP